MFGQSSRYLIPVTWGVLAAGILLLFYVAVLQLSSGSWAHVVAETERLWYWLALLALGFGVQIGLVVALKRHAPYQGAATAAGVIGTGTSTGAMLACCAHHLADVLPLLGLSGAAIFLTRYQLLLIIIGLAANAVGIAYLWHKLWQCRTR